MLIQQRPLNNHIPIAVLMLSFSYSLMFTRHPSAYWSLKKDCLVGLKEYTYSLSKFEWAPRALSIR